MKLLVISCSLSPTSRSAVLAKQLCEAWQAHGAACELLDLREIALPFCDAGAAYSHENVRSLRTKIEGAGALALAVPIYNYDVGGACRNLLAMTGRVWQNKVVGLLAAAGGERSYMSLMPLANSLMLDFRCVIVPRFVYACASSFAQDELDDPELEERLEELAHELRRFSTALEPSVGAQ